MGDSAAACRKGQRKADTVTIAATEAGVPTLVDARKLIDRFHAMFRKRIEADLDAWIEAASQSLVASFASGVSYQMIKPQSMPHWRSPGPTARPKVR